MASEESKRIRAGFARESGPGAVPFEVERRQWEEASLAAPLPPGTTIEPVMADGVPCEWVACSATIQDAALLLLHGGGFTSGSCLTHRELAAHLSAATGVRALVADYRLAPEHPFPAAIEDCATAFRWLVAHGIPPARIVVAGDSAGGDLAVATILALRDRSEPLPGAGVLMSAWLDLTLSGESMVTRDALEPLTSRAGLAHAAALYLGEHDPCDPLASPVFANLGDLPPMLVHVGDHELLLSDSIRLAERGRSAGAAIELVVWPEMWHVFHAFAATLPEARQAVDEIGAFVRRVLQS